MGSGKSYRGRVWAEQAGLPFIDLDEAIERVEGACIADIFQNKGEDYFRSLEKTTLRKLGATHTGVISCGGGTPCFEDNMTWMNQHGVTVYLKASPNFILERVKDEKEKRPLIHKLNEAELLFFIEQKLKEREPFYSSATYTINVDSGAGDDLPDFINTET